MEKIFLSFPLSFSRLTKESNKTPITRTHIKSPPRTFKQRLPQYARGPCVCAGFSHTEREPTMSDLLASIHTLAQNVQALQEESRQRRAAEDAAKAARRQSPSTASSTSLAGESSKSQPTSPSSPFRLP